MDSLLRFFCLVKEEDTKNRIANFWEDGEPIFVHPSHGVSANSAGNWQCLRCGAQLAQNLHAMDGKCVPKTMNGRQAKHWTYRGDPIFADPSHVMTLSDSGNWGCGTCHIWASDNGHALDNVCEAVPVKQAPKSRWSL